MQQTEIMKHTLDKRAETLSLIIPGDILSTNAEELRTEIFELLESPIIHQANWNLLKLDLTAAQMIDSVGLNLLVGLTRAVHARQGRVQAIIRSANIHRTLLFTRLDRQIEITKL